LALFHKPSPFPVFGLVPDLSVLVGVGQFPIISDRYPVFRFVAALDGRICFRSMWSMVEGVGKRPTKSGRLTECMESSDC